jgi:hypothetical protein
MYKATAMGKIADIGYQFTPVIGSGPWKIIHPGSHP